MVADCQSSQPVRGPQSSLPVALQPTATSVNPSKSELIKMLSDAMSAESLFLNLQYSLVIHWSTATGNCPLKRWSTRRISVKRRRYTTLAGMQVDKPRMRWMVISYSELSPPMFLHGRFWRRDTETHLQSLRHTETSSKHGPGLEPKRVLSSESSLTFSVAVKLPWCISRHWRHCSI